MEEECDAKCNTTGTVAPPFPQSPPCSLSDPDLSHTHCLMLLPSYIHVCLIAHEEVFFWGPRNRNNNHLRASRVLPKARERRDVGPEEEKKMRVGQM